MNVSTAVGEHWLLPSLVFVAINRKFALAVRDVVELLLGSNVIGVTPKDL